MAAVNNNIELDWKLNNIDSDHIQNQQVREESQTVLEQWLYNPKELSAG